MQHPRRNLSRSQSFQSSRTSRRHHPRQTEMVVMSQPICHRAPSPDLMARPTIPRPLQSICNEITRSTTSSNIPQCTMTEIKSIHPVELEFGVCISICRFNLDICFHCQTEECKFKCSLDIYPILMKDSYSANDVERVLHSHGVTFDIFRKWFRSHQDCIDWVCRNASAEQIAIVMRLNDSQTEDLKTTSKDAISCVVTSGLMKDWMSIVKKYDFKSVLEHYTLPHVE